MVQMIFDVRIYISYCVISRMIDIFKQELQREHPEHASRVVDALDTPAPISLRLHPHKFDENRHVLPAIPDGPVPWEPLALYFGERPVFTLDPLFHAGAYYVQEASSMWLGEAVRRLCSQGVLPSRPLRVLDLCGAPGGKSTHLASVLSDQDLLVTNEIHRGRAQILTENIIKWGHPNVVVTGNDAGHFQQLGSWFDLVVVDAPCSGEGLFRRDPDAISHWSPDAVAMCTNRQHKILDDIWPALKPGGVLIYSTCTFNRSENDGQVNRLISRYGARGLSLGELNSDEVLEEQLSTGGFMYRCMPGVTKGEGYTFSVVQKPASAEVAYGSSRGSGKFRKVSGHQWMQALELDETFTPISDGKRSYAVLTEQFREVSQIADSLFIHHAGVELGDERRVGHSLALSVSRRSGFFTEIELNKQQALRYLRRESVEADADVSGIVLLTYEGLGLGFGKATRGRVNNHYPQEWRIRMK